ncbi:hypothetical protein Mic7113_6729 (plasmid) [Allocoleopsis franciscana PCC 7113]|uniref:Uncharacterized protein n=1 Tax=Allocoleopsis franciscana PCC 7113 TaxID=1173027 RepID=K9WR73_9CYAN|nr:hypothetical protein Mic7113_6729 [Allocoleopsis franciscana PCC 7113]
MSDRRLSLTNWRTDAQSDSPPCPRQPWYFPFASEANCRECASTGDVVALRLVNAHDAGLKGT